MNRPSDETGAKVVIERAHLQRLMDALKERGYRVMGPTIRDGAVTYGDVASARDLPIGWIDEQEGGSYRLKQSGDEAVFGHVVGPNSLRQFLHVPEVRLWRAERDGGEWTILSEEPVRPKLAFIGVRSCELHAVAVQDRVFANDNCRDPVYWARREDLFIVAVNCGRAGGTCFCVSMKTGPKATAGYDLSLTEVLSPERHYFLVESGTALGAGLLGDVPHRAALPEEADAADRISERTAERMGRTMDTSDIRDLLYRNAEHPRWDDVARRCLSCANCTLVCPTCFCSTVEDRTDLPGLAAERWRRWDSCFTLSFSYLHGGSVRSSAKSRYRQWMVHKLAAWIDQFGTSGCVGCGRCITWCPVGIDLTEEVRAIRESERGVTPHTHGEKSHAVP